MEVLSPRPSSPEFYFNTDASATPYATAPSSPRFSGDPFDRRFHYPSAPTSPSRAATIYSSWDAAGDDDILDFAFDSGRRSEISTADELFEKGRIRPTHPPPPAAARGRERRSPASASRNRARETRSLSPLRDDSSAAPAGNVAKSGAGSSRKWRLKDFLLFRSASEGSATDRVNRDPLFLSSSGNKKKGGDFDSKGGSFRSTESGGGPVRRGGKAQAAAEMHYTAMRAAAEEQRKKTPLAYQRPGLFSCIQFNPAIRGITKGFSGGR